ncbi:hypothetical protein F2Q70_00027451 [Brassica cretica]|uniref:Uncharacterized protein n=1 Tax=Brassica cretica TaxID=69181 RepID=A0A8S9LDT8_BRACR|nr:hypothetical protein F2Q70_00027451 [Brassica cretica]
MCQSVDPRLETMSGLKSRGGYSSSLQVIASSNATTKPIVSPASPIEDRGTAIPIEDRDQVIPERLCLCATPHKKEKGKTKKLRKKARTHDELGWRPEQESYQSPEEKDAAADLGFVEAEGERL